MLSEGIRIAVIAGAFGFLGTLLTVLYNNRSAAQQSTQRTRGRTNRNPSAPLLTWPAGGAIGIIIGIIIAFTFSPTNPSSTPSVAATNTPELPTQALPTNLPAISPATAEPLVGPTAVGNTVATSTQAAATTPPSAGSLNVCADGSAAELLPQPWHLEGKGEASGVGSAEPSSVNIDPNIMQGKNVLRITLDLHGTEFIKGALNDASAIVIIQGHWHAASIVDYAENGMDGDQTIYIPLSEFIGIPDASANVQGGDRLDMNRTFGPLYARFWNQEPFIVDIRSIAACTAKM